MTGGSGLGVCLGNLNGYSTCRHDQLRPEDRQYWQRRGRRALGVGASGIDLSMRMVSRVFVATGVVSRTVRSRIAQDDRKMAFDWRQHETCGDQCAQAKHRKHPRCSPVPGTVTQWECSASHTSSKMPHIAGPIKQGLSLRVL